MGLWANRDHSRQRLKDTLAIPGELFSQSVGNMVEARPITTSLVGLLESKLEIK